MMRFTHSSCTEVSGNLVVEPLLKHATTKVNANATTLMVSWNSRNLRMFSRMERPHLTDATMPVHSRCVRRAKRGPVSTEKRHPPA